MNIGHDGRITATLAQAFYDVLEVARVFHRRRGDPHNFATHRCQLDRLLDGHLRVHRVARDHRLDPDRIRPAHPDAADHHFAGNAAVIMKRISAVIHKTPNLRNRGQAREPPTVLTSEKPIKQIADAYSPAQVL